MGWSRTVLQTQTSVSQAGRVPISPLDSPHFLLANQPVLHTGILAMDTWVRMILSVWPWVLPKVGQRSSRQPGAPTPSQEGRSKQAVLGQTPVKLTTGGDTAELGSVLFALCSTYIALNPLDKPQSQPRTPATPGCTIRTDHEHCPSPSIY